MWSCILFVCNINKNEIKARLSAVCRKTENRQEETVKSISAVTLNTGTFKMSLGQLN